MSSGLDLQVLLFASIAEQAGCNELRLPFVEGETIAALRHRLSRRLPNISDGLKDSRLALNETFADESEQLAAGDCLAVIPPVAGG